MTSLSIEVAVRLPACSPLNLQISDIAKANWLLEPDGTFSLSFDHCRLKTYTAKDTKKCLSFNHLVFMGDSLSRYFYISFASLVATGPLHRREVSCEHNVGEGLLLLGRVLSRVEFSA